MQRTRSELEWIQPLYAPIRLTEDQQFTCVAVAEAGPGRQRTGRTRPLRGSWSEAITDEVGSQEKQGHSGDLKAELTRTEVQGMEDLLVRVVCSILVFFKILF